jgi:hypothetical protein
VNNFDRHHHFILLSSRQADAYKAAQHSNLIHHRLNPNSAVRVDTGEDNAHGNPVSPSFPVRLSPATDIAPVAIPTGIPSRRRPTARIVTLYAQRRKTRC